MKSFRFIRFLLLSSLLFPSPAFSDVVFDAAGTAIDVQGLTTRDFTTLTVGAGTNRALAAIVTWTGAPVGITMIWDPTGANQALASIVENQTSTNNQKVVVWGLANPTSGNKTLRVSWTGTQEIIMNAFSVTGANQAGGAATFKNTATALGTSAAPSITVNSQAGNMPVAAVACCSAQSLNTWNQTSIFLTDGIGLLAGAGSRGIGAPSLTFSGTLAGSDVWAAAAMDIQAANVSFPSPTTGMVIRGGKVTIQ